MEIQQYPVKKLHVTYERLLELRFVRSIVEKPTSAASPKLSSGAMAVLPAPLRQLLGQALVTLDSNRILELIEVIEQTAPGLAAVLRERVEQFDCQAILASLELTLPSGKESNPRKNL